MSNSYLCPDLCEYGDIYLAIFTKEYQNSEFAQNCLYTRDIIQPWQYSKVFKYYVYLRNGTSNKIDGIGTEITDDCVGTLLAISPIKISRGTFTPIHGIKADNMAHLHIDYTPIAPCGNSNSYDSIIDQLRLETLNKQDEISINIESIFEAIVRYRFDGNYDAATEFCKTTKGSHRIAVLIGEEVKSKIGEIMCIARRIKTNDSKRFIINYVWVDESGVYDYRGALDDHGIIFNSKFLDKEMALTESQYNTIVEKWKNKWPNR